MAGEEDIGTRRSHKMGQGEMGLGMLVRRQVNPRWENDPMWLKDGIIQESCQGRVQAPTPRRESGGGRRRAEQVNKSGVA